MNKNLCTIRVTVTKQTRYNLCRLAAANGWGDKDLGRVIDKLVRNHLLSLKRCCIGEGRETQKGENHG